MDLEILLEVFRQQVALEDVRCFNLQMFAAEDEGRTEQPTDYKKKKARDEGNVPKSQELTAIIVFLLSFWTLALLGKQTFIGIKQIMQFYLVNLLDIDLSPSNLGPFFLQVVWLVGRVILPILVVAMIAAIVGNVGQTGFIFTTKKLTANFGKIFSNMGKNLAKMFWSGETIFNLIKSLFKVLGVFAVAFFVLNSHTGEILTLIRMSMGSSFLAITGMVFQFVNIAGVMLLIFALIDYAFQRWQYIQSLKMTKQEVKEEMKEMEGDPMVKAKIREMERRMLSKKMMREVPNADVVITNPTHFAIAIKYNPDYMSAPVVVAKGEDNMARKIKEIARENDVFIIENRPLARELYKKVEVGDEIPPELFAAVAKVLTLVYQMKAPVEIA